MRFRKPALHRHLHATRHAVYTPHIRKTPARYEIRWLDLSAGREWNLPSITEIHDTHADITRRAISIMKHGQGSLNNSALQEYIDKTRGEPSLWLRVSYVSLANAILLEPRCFRQRAFPFPVIMTCFPSPIFSTDSTLFTTLPLTSKVVCIARLPYILYTSYTSNHESKMRLHRDLILIAFLIGLAQCFFFDFVIPPATTALEQPQAVAVPAELTTTSDEQSSLISNDEAPRSIVPDTQPESTQMETRDVPPNLDYKCGPKWGKCPGGTCCSSAGESDRTWREWYHTHWTQAIAARPRLTVVPLTA